MIEIYKGFYIVLGFVLLLTGFVSLYGEQHWFFIPGLIFGSYILSYGIHIKVKKNDD